MMPTQPPWMLNVADTQLISLLSDALAMRGWVTHYRPGFVLIIPKERDMPEHITADQPIATICEQYARLCCAAREIGGRNAGKYHYTDALHDAARFLYDHAPKTALAHLDTVKRILEIDPDVTDPNLVLLRASHDISVGLGGTPEARP